LVDYELAVIMLPFEGGGEDRDTDLVQSDEELLAVAVAGQHPA
jgi:hypothetical protein